MNQEPDQPQNATPGPASEQRVEELVTLSCAEYEELKTLARERDDYLKRLQRAVADYQNLQKRVERTRDAAREALIRSLTEEILPVADSLARALEAAGRTEGADEIVAGLALVEKEFYDALGRLGVRPLEAVGRKFDPHYHEAAMTQRAAGVAPNTVMRELKKGFVLGNAVIRPSQVVVSCGPEEHPQDAGAGEGPGKG